MIIQAGDPALSGRPPSGVPARGAWACAPIDRVVVGFDGSSAALAAATWGASLAERHHARLEVLTCAEQRRPRTLSPPDLRPKPLQRRCVHGRTAAELVHACGTRDLLVIGASRHTGTVHHGSVAHACIRTATGPVAVVPTSHPQHLRQRVMVAVDGSDASRAALAVAAEEAKLLGAALHAVHAVHWDTLGTTLMRPSDKDLISWGRRLVRAELDRAGIRAHSVVVPGHAVDVLVRHSMYADLLVVGSPKQRPFTGRMLASTAELCALRSHCAAVLVRPA